MKMRRRTNMTNLEKKLIAYANNVIDSRSEWEGPNNVLPGLVEFGFIRDELIEMGFDEDAVDIAIEENKEEK
jgi:hypothetical protein